MKEFAALVKRKEKVQKAEDQKADFRSGIICSVLANIYRNKKKKQTPYKPKDFMPRKEVKEQTPEQQLKMVAVLNTAFGGKDLRGGVENK